MAQAPRLKEVRIYLSPGPEPVQGHGDRRAWPERVYVVDAATHYKAALDANTRSRVLPGLPQFFPEANPLDLLPNAMFNGTAMPGTIGVFQYERRFPFYGYNTLWNFAANLTRVQRTHNTLRTDSLTPTVVACPREC